jgi:hypothetical protein
MLAALAFLRSISNKSIGLNEITREAVELSRKASDPMAKWFAPFCRVWLLREGIGDDVISIEEERALAAEVLELGRTSGDRYVTETGYRLGAMACLRSGDRTGFERGFAEAGRLAQEIRSEVGMSSAFGAHVAAAELDGRLDDAEALLHQSTRSGSTNIAVALADAIRTGFLRLCQGRLDEYVPIVRGQAQLLPWAAGFRAALALGLVRLGRTREAEEILCELAADNFLAVRSGSSPMSGAALLADVCGYLGEPQYAQELYALVCPQSGVLVTTLDAWCTFGATDRFLGTLAAMTGDAGKANDHFRAALDFEEGLRAPMLAAQTRYWWARMLPDDPSSDQRLDRCIEAARDFGMAQLEKEALELRESR